MGNRNKKWSAFYVTGICLLFFYLSLCIARSCYERSIFLEPYDGLLVGRSHIYGKKKNNIEYTNFVLINPNNLKEIFVVNTDEVDARFGGKVCRIVMKDNKFYCLIDKQNELFLVHIPGDINKMLVISRMPHESKLERLEMFLHEKNIYVGIDKAVYCIDPDTGAKKLIWDNKQKKSGVFPYKQGVITSCSECEAAFFEDGQRKKIKLPQGLTLKGVCGEKLIMGNKQQVVLYNTTTGAIKGLLQEDFEVIETINDRTIIVMLLPASGGPADLLDFYYEWMDFLRKEHFGVYMPCIYDVKNRNIVNFPWCDAFFYLQQHSWQNSKWDKKKLQDVVKKSFGNVRYVLEP